MHWNVLKYFIYIKGGSVVQSEVVHGLTYVIVVWFVPSCYPDLASSAHLNGSDEVRMHPLAIHCILKCSNTLYI